MDVTRRRVLLTVLASAVLLWPWPGRSAEPPQVYDGLTPRALADFAEREGWRAEVSQSSANVVIHVDDKRIDITLTNCKDGLCTSGIIRDMTYHSIPLGGACGLWHWNLESLGATGFGNPVVVAGNATLTYTTLQRHLQFRGVTDQYLRDVVDAWIATSASFWTLVAQCADDQDR